MLVFIIFSFVSVIIYSTLIFSFYMAWERCRAFETSANKFNFFTSIIIPARNEALHISYLLSDLQNQEFEKSAFEIILVDDHSEDNTKEIAEELILQMGNLHIIELKSHEHGKKKAIESAVNKSKGELIITIDADCRVGKNWLSTIVSFYGYYKPKLIVCPLLFQDENNFFEIFQSLDIMGMVASGSGALLMGRPILCNGANLAFARDTYQRVIKELNPNVASGDDLFLLFAVKRLWPEEIKYLKSVSALSITNPERNLKNFLQQRKRWTSKFKYYRDKDVILVAGIVFMANLVISISFLISFFSSKALLLYFSLMLLKTTADILLINSFAGFFEKRNILKYFWLAQLIYPFYFTFISIYGNMGKFIWKSRIYK